MTFSLEACFDPAGPVARVLGDSFEPRPQQRRMARAVADAFDSRARLLVEAGTGVGKSFAYLLPAMARIMEHKERVVIATNTISLQEQIVEKDAPTVRRSLEAAGADPSFKIALVKGRGNYLSIRRLQLASRKRDRLFADPASRRSLQVIEDWAYDTADGTLATLPVLERPGVWGRAQSDSAACMGRKCPTHQVCFYQRARRQMETADLLICNHAIVCSDLALRARGVQLLPHYDHIVIDEAHALEETASDHFGLSLAEGRIGALLASLCDARRGRGLLPALAQQGEAEAIGPAMQAVMAAHESSSLFFDQLVSIAQEHGEAGQPDSSVTLPDDGTIDNMLTPAMRDLTLHLKRTRQQVRQEEDRYEINAMIERAQAIADDAEALCERRIEGAAHWIETKRRGRGVTATIRCSPIDVAPALRESLFSQDCSVVLTSATLTTAGGSFAHISRRLGCGEPNALALGSPFDLERQIDLIVEASAPDPRSAGYVEALADRALEHIVATKGGAFVLFTSYRTLNLVADRLAPMLTQRDMPMWAQGRDGSRREILGAFRSANQGVLLGTTSFWQGVDVSGRALRNVIITRLPFEPPDRPLTKARLAQIKEQGGDPFRDDSLPRAVVRFKQGFGRLIRSATDRGRVVVLDPRIVTKRYGRAFLEALPPGVIERMTVRSDADQVAP